MTTKIYRIPLHRKIAEGTLKSTPVVSADLYLDQTKTLNVDVNNNVPKSEIYSIKRDKKYFTAYTNTLDISLTDKEVRGVPLYKLIILESDAVKTDNFLSELAAMFGNEYLVSEINTGSQSIAAIFLNTDQTVLKLDNNEYFVISSVSLLIQRDYMISVTSNPDLKITRLKDRLKIRYRTDTSDNIHIKLNSENLLTPKHFKDFVTFPECVLKDRDNKHVHIYTHSWNEVQKVEVQNKDFYSISNIKEQSVNPVVDKVDVGDHSIVNYYCINHNLKFNIGFNTEMHFYINYGYINKTQVLIQSPVKINSPDLLHIYSINPPSSTYDITVNEYIEGERSKLKGEFYSLMFDKNKDKKYNKHDDLRFGSERIILNTNRLLVDLKPYAENGNGKILQSKSAYIPQGEGGLPAYSVDLPDYFVNNLNLLRSTLPPFSHNHENYYEDIYYTKGE